MNAISPQNNSRPRALLLAGGNKPNVAASTKRLKPLIDAHVEVVFSDLTCTASLDDVEADLAIVLGGDGSIMRAVKQMGTRQIPVLGVNFGKLGFLADTPPDQLEEALRQVCQRRYRVVHHMMFHCQVLHQQKVLAETLGLNETSILGGPPYQMMDVNLSVDGDWATTYSCDGLILATPVGSTAHSLSAGGPILRKDVQAFVIAPISPHTLTVRPVIDAADRVYEMWVESPNEVVSVVVDGTVLHRLTSEHRVRVQQAKPSFQMVEVEGRSYYRTLREKLGWGGRLKRVEEQSPQEDS